MKHLEANPKFDAFLLKGPVNELHEIIFDVVTEVLTQNTSIRTKGTAGP